MSPDEYCREKVAHRGSSLYYSLVFLPPEKRRGVIHYHYQAFEKLPEADRAPQQSHIILANLAMALLQEIEADRFRVLEHRIALTPLRKLWLAWRTRRREERRLRLCPTENT